MKYKLNSKKNTTKYSKKISKTKKNLHNMVVII